MKQTLAKPLSTINKRSRSGFKKPGYIGFDLGLEKLNMVQVDFSSIKPVIVSASSDYHNSNIEELLTQPKKLQTLVKSVFKQTGFKGREIVATVPNKLLKLLFINYTCKSQDDETKALIKALQNRIDDNIADYVIDFLPINPHRSEQINRMALVAMVKQDEIENYLELLDSCKLKVAALEISPIAIKRLISAISNKNDSKKVLVINFSAQNSYLTVLWNKEVLLDRKLEFGMENILNAITRALDITPQTALDILHKYGVAEQRHDLTVSPTDLYEIEKDGNDDDISQLLIDIVKPGLMTLANEIKNVLVYVASETRGGTVEQIYLMGSLARIADIDQLLDHMISIPVKTINPFYCLPYHDTASPDDIGPVAGIAVATGLALRGRV